MINEQSFYQEKEFLSSYRILIYSLAESSTGDRDRERDLNKNVSSHLAAQVIYENTQLLSSSLPGKMIKRTSAQSCSQSQIPFPALVSQKRAMFSQEIKRIILNITIPSPPFEGFPLTNPYQLSKRRSTRKLKGFDSSHHLHFLRIHSC